MNNYHLLCWVSFTSSLSSGQNSTSASLLKDMVEPIHFYLKQKTMKDTTATWIAKFLGKIHTSRASIGICLFLKIVVMLNPALEEHNIMYLANT